MRPSRTLLVVASVAALAVAGCATRPASHPAAARAPAAASTGAPAAPAGSQPGTAPAALPAAASASPATPVGSPGQPSWPTGPRSTPQTDPAALLVAIRTGRHATFDRVVFEFRGRVPGYDIRYVPAVTQDPSGRPVALRGRAFLRVAFRHASAVEQLAAGCPPYRATYTGPRTITTSFASLRQLELAGDFEGYLSFGVGLGQRVGFRVLELTDPSRVVLDVAHAPTPPRPFPGIWDIRTWAQARAVQQAVDDGHQPWRTDPAQVVAAYTRAVLLPGSAQPLVRQVGPHTFQVRKPGGEVIATVQVTQPLRQGPGGIWVVTHVDRIA